MLQAADLHERGRAAPSARRAAPSSSTSTASLVIHDEIDLPFGDIRVAARRRAGRPQRPEVAASASSAAPTSTACASASGARTRPTRTSSPPTCSARWRQPRRRGRRAGRRARPTRPSGSCCAERLDWTQTPPRIPARSFGVLAGGWAPCRSAPSSPISSTIPPRLRLADEGGDAFVSQSLRPFVVAALADRDAAPPALVVVGDDRAARDLAADLRAWLHPRPVRYYPSRGVAYESHLTPPPHLVGLRVAALDALTDTPEGSEQPVVVVSADGAVREGARPRAAPARLHAARRRPARPRRGRPASSWPRATSASTRSRSAASSRSAAACSTSTRRPRSARSASTCSTSRSRRCAGSRPSPSARSGEADCVEIAPAAELAPEHRELAEIAARRGGAAATSPSCCRSTSFRELLDLVPERRGDRRRRRGGRRAGAARPLGGRLRGVPRRRGARTSTSSPTRSSPRSQQRAAVRLSARSPPTSRSRSAPRPPTSPRARCARPRPSWRSSPARATRPSSPGRSAARPSAPPTTSPALKADAQRRHDRPGLHRGQPARRLRRRRASSSPRSPSTG